VPATLVLCSGCEATISLYGGPSVSATTPYSYISAGSANQDSQVVKALPGQLYGYDLFNNAAAVRYVRIYDKATPPTSADTPVRRLELPAGGGAVRLYGNGLNFNAGIAFRITTGPTDGDTGTCVASDVYVNLDYI